MNEKKTIAVYGGTFSPPHVGHIRAAESFFRTVAPDRFLIVPSAIPPHKAPVSGADDEDRLTMCRLAFASIPSAEVSDMEILRQGKSYTVETLRTLAVPGTRLILLVGTDMLLTLDTWYSFEELFRLAEIAYVRRESDPGTAALLKEKERCYVEKYGARICALSADVTEISSTELRRRITSGESLEGYLLPEVEAYIKARGLYRV